MTYVADIASRTTIANLPGRSGVLVDDQPDTGNGIPLGKHMKPLCVIKVSVI